MRVEIHSDVICPWCFVGLRRFQAARAARPELELDAQFLPFELNPGLPVGGVDVGDPAVLLDVGRAAGLDADVLEDSVHAQRDADAVARAELAAIRLGIRGVPAFVFAHRYLVSGAQPVDVLLEIADRVAALAGATRAGS